MCFYKFENKSARILHISVGDGQTLAIPPVEGGITLEIEDSQKPALQANIATPAVQAWITDGQLTITEVEEAPPPDPEVEGEGGVARGGLEGEPPPPAVDYPPADTSVPETEDTPRRGHKRGRHEGEP